MNSAHSLSISVHEQESTNRSVPEKAGDTQINRRLPLFPSCGTIATWFCTDTEQQRSVIISRYFSNVLSEYLVGRRRVRTM